MGKLDVRPLRTVLFCGGDRPDDIERGFASGADSIVIDLEEPRTPFPESERDKARQIARSFVDGAGPGPVIFARIQPARTGQTLKDLRAVMGGRLGGVLVPKIESPADVHAVDALLGCMEVEHGLEMGTTAIYPILETAQSLRLA
jgi:citrate lyase subunit beta/citryl-CoA lyase